MKFLRKLMGGAPSIESGDPREALRTVWTRLIASARDPQWYVAGAVADHKEGRFAMVTTLLALLLLRLEAEDGDQPGGLADGADIPPRYGQQSAWLAELFVDDMDAQLRQDGVGDMVVGKHIGRLMSALGGRIGALRDALLSGEAAALEPVIERNIPRNVDDADKRALLAGMLLDWHRALQPVAVEALLEGALPAVRVPPL